MTPDLTSIQPGRPGSPPLHTFLVGGGMMGELMRAFDWSSSPVGPPHEWPQSLRTSLSILLDSRYPMYIAWGPEFTQFYNDAYRPILGAVKHPAALGRSTRETFSEIWDFIGPMFERVMSRGEPTYLEDQILPMDRNGYIEECYFTFCYSAIRGESGEPGGVLVTVVETTERVLGERRLRTLREMADRALGAKSVEDACRDTIAALGGNDADVPFSLLYLLDEERRTARLVAHAGIDAGTDVSPLQVDLHAKAGAEAGCPWPLAEAARTGEPLIVEGIDGWGPAIPRGPWPEPLRSAAVMLTSRPGQESTLGLLVAGLSARRAYDDGYAGFLSLVTGQIGTSIANARAYEEERRRAEMLAEIDRAKTVFFSNVSHEFRTPLTLLLAPVEDLLADPKLHSAQRERLRVAQRNALRLLKLVNSLLDFSRIEAGRVEASFEPTDLSALTAELASSFRSAVERAGLELVVECAPLPQPVYVDRDMWEKIVLNLISNAFKHTFEGAIRVALRVDRAAVELSVSDSGVGIPAEHLPRVFDRFHRVVGTRGRTQEGSGIGLALVQELVRMHAGEIDVASKEGEGTTFRVRIPLGAAHLPADRVHARRERASTALGAAPFVEEAARWIPDARADAASVLELAIAPLTRNGVDAREALYDRSGVRGDAPRVVLADDNADMRDYVARLLRERGWRVEAVPDGLTALEHIQREPPDVVVSDVMMPGLDGFGLLRELRADVRTQAVPVILLSARAGEEARVEGMDAGADDYLVKPFSARELVSRVETHAALARARSAATAEREAAWALLNRVLEQAPVAICVTEGPEHRFVLANPLYQRFLPNRQLVGRALRDAIPEIDGQGIIELMDRVYQTGEPQHGTSVRLLYDRDGDGGVDETFFNFIYHPMTDAAGTVTGVAAVAVEITEEVRARRDAEAARAEAEEARRVAESASQAKSDFLRSMSHELRTPLNAIGGYVQLIDMGLHGPVTPAQRDALARVQRSQEHLLSLINDVLNLARIETGRIEYAADAIPMDDAVADVVAMMEPLVSTRGLSLDVIMPARGASGDGKAPHIRADRERLRQILINLLSNAVKFTAPGGHIRIEAVPPGPGGGAAELRVRDTGVGIAADRLEAIFDPFVQAGRRLHPAEDGFGLGLAISRELARGMGGDLTVESSPGVGSTFILTLPEA